MCRDDPNKTKEYPPKYREMEKMNYMVYLVEQIF